jgi:hypothetical protein
MKQRNNPITIAIFEWSTDTNGDTEKSPDRLILTALLFSYSSEKISEVLTIVTDEPHARE